jgi:hypothetical protein
MNWVDAFGFALLGYWFVSTTIEVVRETRRENAEWKEFEARLNAKK